MMELAGVIIGLLLIQDLALTLLLEFNYRIFSHEVRTWPAVSILIPSRDEEENLPECLEALANLDYPPEKLQIILGNDQSSDRTAQILQAWVAQSELNARYVEISMTSVKLNGKAKALAQMCRLAEGDLLLFTDADCRPKPAWVKAMVTAQLSSGAGIVTGVTQVRGKNLFTRLQGLDWWLTLGMVKTMSDLGLKLTSMGNNMLVSKKAYEAVGGFEGIPFSLTEDFEMAKQVAKKGFSSVHLTSKDNLILTEPKSSFVELLSQRKRWMKGAMTLPLAWKILLGLQVLFFPSILIFIFLHPFEGILVWLAKVIVQGLFIYRFASKTGVRIGKRYLLLFELYYLITSWSTIVYYFWPAKTAWKGRKYG